MKTLGFAALAIAAFTLSPAWAATTPTQQAYFKASNAGTRDEFGRSVAISGDTVVIGAQYESSNAVGVNGNQTDNSAFQSGAAYVFVRNGSNWIQQAYLKASNTGSEDYFGWSIAISENTIVVGAPFEDSNTTGVNGNQSNNGASSSGAVYVFVRNGTNWVQQAYLKASNTGGPSSGESVGDTFGWSVAMSGDTVVVGSIGEDSIASGVNGNQGNNSAANSGAAYVFVRNGTNWAQQAYLKASNSGGPSPGESFGDAFGKSVGVSGDTVIVGADGEDSNATGVNGIQTSNSALESGAAYVFVRNGTNWTQQGYLKASNTQSGDEFGAAVAISGDTVVAGAPKEDSSTTGVDGNQSNNTTPNSGAVYVFMRNGTNWSQQAYLKSSHTDAEDDFGFSVALSGDVLVVGKPGDNSNAIGINGNQSDNSASYAGAAYVFQRDETNWSQRAYLKASNTGGPLPGEDYGDDFGADHMVAVSGGTVVVGAHAEDSNGIGVNGNQTARTVMDSGAAYVFTGFGAATPTQSTYEPYFFTTLAGGGGFSSSDIPGSAARVRDPLGVALDSEGNLYVAEQGNNTISKVTPTGAVTTLAGRPGSFGSADGVGNAARFNGPSAVAVDSAGNVYVADTFNCTIRKVTPAGEVTTLAGLAGNPGSADGTGSAARFNFPFGLTTDSAGNVYVADSDNNTIRKVTPVGTNWVVTTIAGLAGSFGGADGTGSNARFTFPSGLAVDATGNLYVGDSLNHTIRRMTLVGANWVVTTVAGLAGNRGSVDGTNRNARFNEPGGMAFDSAGNLYVADWANSTIRKMTPVGTNWVVTTAAGLAGRFGSVNGTNSDARFDIVGGVAADSADNVYVADVANNLIRKMTLSGTNWVVTTLAGLGGNSGGADGPANVATFKGPSGVDVDGDGNAYVADTLNHTIRKMTAAGQGIPSGEVTTLAGLAGYAGSTDGTNSAARFNAPTGVAVDKSGNIYVAETLNHTIRRITPVGSNWVVTTLAGFPDPTGNGGSSDGTGSSARFSFPRGLAVDGAGNLYVADAGNNTIRRVTATGLVTTRAGSAGEIGSADGTGTAARFNSPNGVAVDSAANIYVADTYNHTVRRITPAQVVTTLAGQAGSPGDADGIGNSARFDFPSSIAVDLAGNLYVADTYNNTIRKLTLVGTNWVVTTLGGTPGFYGTANGAGGIARFSNPTGIAVDGEGNVYVADFYFNTIRKGFPPPRITYAYFVETHFKFNFTGAPGQTVIVEASTDLSSWLPIWTNTLIPDLIFSEPRQSGVLSKRFFRARMP